MVLRVRMTRGKNARVTSARQVAVMRPGPIDALMNRLDERELMRPVVRLRPIGNLKN
jgi:RNA-splicing ligase RtcB